MDAWAVLVNVSGDARMLVGVYVRVSKEALLVTAVNGTLVTVVRARQGTQRAPHAAGEKESF